MITQSISKHARSIWNHPSPLRRLTICSPLYRWSINGLSMIYRWYIIGISMIYRWSIDDRTLCWHERASYCSYEYHTKTLWSWCQNLQSAGFPASIYRSKWSIIAGQGSNMKKISKESIFWKLFLDFYIDPGGPGSHPGGSRTDPGAEKHRKNKKEKF